MSRFDRPYVAHAEAEVRKTSAVRLAQTIAAASEVVLAHRRLALSNCVWWHTEADGKWRTRYRSAEVVNGSADQVQHEHVVTRKELVDRMIADPDHIEAILSEAVACLVTRSEHRRLATVDPALRGWDRYRAAGVVVVDMLTGEQLI